ncbi:MAG: glycosyltransferase [Candidatus Kapabacteria bacterium]|nr:glycosyltransferase [Candidatus Kapabacteria bacterium]
MKNIAIIGPAYPYRGGPPLVVANLYELLSKRHTVNVFSFTRLYPSLLFPGVRQEDVSKHPAKPHPVLRLIDSVNPLTWIRTADAVIASKPDLVLLDWYQPFFGLCYDAILTRIRRAGIKVVVLAENVISHEARWIDTFLTHRALRHAQGFVAFSDAVVESLRNRYPSVPVSRSTLPLFFTGSHAPVQWTKESARAHLGYDTAKEVILFFGYIRKYKGLRNLLAAFPAVAAARPEAELLVVGECYEDAAEYTALIQASGVAHRIRWVNEYVPNEDVALYYSAADVIALPYNSATQSGIVKIAFGFGKAVVATNVGGLTEEVAQWNAGIITEPGDTAAFANALITMLGSDRTDYENGSHAAAAANSFAAIEGIIDGYLG